MILIIIGKSCSGKTILRKIIENEYGIIGFEASHIVKEYIKNKNMSLNNLFTNYGKDFVAQHIIQHSTDKNYVISGFRTVEEIEYIKKYNKVLVITIYSSDRKCFQRSVDRNRNDTQNSFENFYLNKLCADYSLGLAESIRRYSDYFIENSDDISILKNKINKIIGLSCGKNLIN